MTGRAPAIAVVLLLAVAGCAGLLAGKDAAPRPPPRACATDADCSRARHEVCRVADGSGTPSPEGSGSPLARFTGICVIPALPSTSEVYLEVRPVSPAVPATQLGPVELASGQNQQLVLPRPATVTASVVDHATQRPVGQAKVRFRLTPLIPDRPLSFDATAEGADGQTPGRLTRLLPAGSYGVTLVPPAPAGLVIQPPPEHPFVGAVPLSQLAPAPQTFALSDSSELVTFAGAASLEHDGQVVPAAKVEVWAMAADSVPAGETGAKALAGTALAQPVTTDALGRFTLWLPRLSAGEAAHTVRLQFGPASDGAAFPSFVDPTVYTVDASGAQPSKPPPSATVDSPVEVTGHVQLLRHSGLVGLANARVTFHTADDSPFSYTTTVVTDENGAYDVQLFPGTYQPLAAMPPPDGQAEGVPIGLCAPASDQNFEIDSGSAAKTRDFLCAPAAPLAGDARYHDVKVPFVAVEAVRHKDQSLAEGQHLLTTSDAGGVFAMYVPPGDYDLILTPPASTKLPVTIDHIGEVPNAADQAPARLVIELDPPFELFGQLFSGDAAHPVAASIEAYAVGPDGTSQLVGQGAASADGSYSLILPASGP